MRFLLTPYRQQSQRSRCWALALVLSCLLLQVQTAVSCTMMDDYLDHHCCCDESQSTLLGELELKQDGCCELSAQLSVMAGGAYDDEPLNDHLQLLSDWQPPPLPEQSLSPFFESPSLASLPSVRSPAFSSSLPLFAATLRYRL